MKTVEMLNDIKNEIVDMEENNFKNNFEKFFYGEEIEEIKKDAFVIQTDREANYVIKELKNIKNKKEKIEQSAKESLADYTYKINAFKENLLSPLSYQEDRYTELLKAYILEKTRDTKTHSIKFLEGIAGFKKTQDKYTYNDEEILNFLKEKNPQMYKEYTVTNIELNKRKFKKAGSANKEGNFVIEGTVIPGVTVEKQEDSFNVK